MVTLKWTRNGEAGQREFGSQFLADRFAKGLVRTGYTIVEDAPAAEATEQTGRIGKGLEIHRIVAGVAHCGSSYRARQLGGTLSTKVTGEAITCTKCLGH